MNASESGTFLFTLPISCIPGKRIFIQLVTEEVKRMPANRTRSFLTDCLLRGGAAMVVPFSIFLPIHVHAILPMTGLTPHPVGVFPWSVVHPLPLSLQFDIDSSKPSHF